jgi:hypothetical protein
VIAGAARTLRVSPNASTPASLDGVVTFVLPFVNEDMDVVVVIRLGHVILLCVVCEETLASDSTIEGYQEEYC